MARNIDDIQRDIEKTRQQLAVTLDEIADRTSPQNLMEDAKEEATAKLQDPTVQKVLIGAGVALVAFLLLKGRRARKNRKELKEVKELLANR